MSKSHLVVGLFALGWMLLISSVYFVGHKPFSPSLAANLGRAVGQTLAVLGLVSTAGGLGRRLRLEWGLRPLGNLAIQAAFGLGLLSLVYFLVGTVVGVSPAAAWANLLILGFFLRREVVSWWCSWRDLGEFWNESDWLGKFLGVGVMLILVFSWTTALAPPAKYDALVYHLVLPRHYLAAGNFEYVPEIMFWGMPQVGEVLYTWAMGLAGLEAAPVLGWAAGLLAVTGLTAYTASRFGTRAGWIAVSALLAGNTLAVSLGWGYVDWNLALFGIGFLASLDRLGANNQNPVSPFAYSQSDSGENLEKRILITAGVFAGLALGSKYTGGVLFLVGLAAIAWIGVRRGLRKTMLGILRFSLAVLLVTLPWGIKNYVATGNPLYPFFLPSGEMTSFRQSLYQMPVWGNWLEIFLLPWRATLEGIEGGPGYSASIGPLLLALAPLSVITWFAGPHDRRLALATSAWVALTGLLVWAGASRFSGFLIQSRLYWSIFPSLAVLAAGGFSGVEALKWPGLRFGRVAGVFIAVVFTFTVLQASLTALSQGSPQMLLDLQSQKTYQENNLGWYAPAIHAAIDLPDPARVLMLWEPRSLGCEDKCLPDEVLDRWLRDLRMWGSPEAVLESWQEAGITHLFYYRFGAESIQSSDSRYSSADWKALGILLRQLPPPRDFGGIYELYSLTP